MGTFLLLEVPINDLVEVKPSKVPIADDTQVVVRDLATLTLLQNETVVEAVPLPKHVLLEPLEDTNLYFFKAPFIKHDLRFEGSAFKSVDS